MKIIKLSEASNLGKCAIEQKPMADEPHGWVTWWPAMGGGHKAIYSHGATKPSYGPELAAMLRVYAVYDRVVKKQQPVPIVQEPMTWEQFKAVTLETLPDEYEEADFDAVSPCGREELMRGVRMLERFHGITGVKT